MNAATVDRGRAPAAGPIRPFRFPEVQHLTLSNGMPVLFARTGGLPVATLSLLLPAGAVREDSTQAGMATLTGALLESGTAELSADDVSQRLEGLGVRLHVGTSWEISHVDFTAIAGSFEAAGELMGTLVREPAFRADEFERLRNEQLSAILQRRAEPRGFANEMAARFIFAEESPFSRPIYGTTATVSGLDHRAIREFHARTYTPRSAALIAAGNVDLEAIRSCAENALGGWMGRDLAPSNAAVRPRSEGVQVIIVDRPAAVQSEIRVGHIGVARSTPDYFPILVMNTILGGAFSSRLNLNLREKHGFTYGVRSSFAMRRNPGPFLVSTAVQTEVTGAAVREIVLELARIRADEVAPEELADARQYVAGTFPLPLETTDGVASRLAELFIYDLPESYLEDFPERVFAVDRRDVLMAARTHIHPDHLTVVILGDAELVRPQLEVLDLAPVEVIRAESTA